LRVFYSTDFKGYWAVGTAAVGVAETVDEAAGLLAEELASRGLYGGFTVKEIQLDSKKALILCDGNY